MEVKNLDQLMGELLDTDIVSIGSAQAYFFIGTKAEYEATIDAVSNELREKLRATRREMLDTRDLFCESYDDLADTQPECRWNQIPDEEYKRIAKLAETLRKSASAMPRIKRRLPIVEQQIVGFKPVRKRAVLEFYPRIDPDGGWCVIVEGSEYGKYWTLEEYRNRNNQPGEEEQE